MSGGLKGEVTSRGLSVKCKDNKGLVVIVVVTVHPLIQVPNQLVGAPTGTDVTLHCHVEASPKAINYWTRETGN